MPKTTRASAQYIALALFFALAATYQTRFLIDLWRDFTFRYSAPPFTSGTPWPTTVDVFDRAQEAGLQPGDEINAIDGRSVDGWSDLFRPIRLKRPGDTIAVIAEREGIERRVVIPLTSVRSKRISVPVYTHAALMLVLMPVFCLLLGFGVAAIRPRDPMAWLLLILLVSLSQNFMSNVGVNGWSQGLRILSHFYRALGTLWPASMVLFGIYFTSRWRIDARYPWIKWLLIAPLVAQTLFTMAMQTGMSESYRTVEPLVDTFSRRGPAGTVAGLLGIVLFFVAIGSKSRDPDNDKDARRRFRLLLWGSAVSLIPLSCLLVFLLIYGFRDNLWSAVPTMLTLLFPVTIAHVIVVHRAMDVRVAIRQGVRSTFVRNGVHVLQVIVSAAVVILITILTGRREMPLAARLAVVSLAVASVFFVRTIARSVADWVDRRFFRESYRADGILSDLSAQVSQMLEILPLFQTVAERLSSTLHVPKVAFLVAQNGGFEPAFALGYEALPPVRFVERAGTIVQLEPSRDRCACVTRMGLPGSTMSATRNGGNWTAWGRSSCFRWREGIGCSASSAWARSVPKSPTPRRTFGSLLRSRCRPAWRSTIVNSPRPWRTRSRNESCSTGRSRSPARCSSGCSHRPLLPSKDSNTRARAGRLAVSAATTTTFSSCRTEVLAWPLAMFRVRAYQPRS